jgi:chromosome segregation ATPase
MESFMGATVVNTSLTVSAWTKAKPADFKGKDLDNALKGAEGLDAKKIAMPAKLPTVPKLKISEIETCVTELEADIITLQKALAELKKMESAFQAVSSAANKTSSELQKMEKDKKASEDQKQKYHSAAQTASVMGSNAAGIAANLK